MLIYPIEVQLTDCSFYVVDFMCTFSADTISESLPVRDKEKYERVVVDQFLFGLHFMNKLIIYYE